MELFSVNSTKFQRFQEGSWKYRKGIRRIDNAKVSFQSQESGEDKCISILFGRNFKTSLDQLNLKGAIRNMKLKSMAFYFVGFGFFIFSFGTMAQTKPTVRSCNLRSTQQSGISIDALQNAEALQACIDSALSGDIIELNPGSYPLQKVILINKPLTFRTKGLSSKFKCERDLNFRCAQLMAVSPIKNIQRGFIQIQSPDVTFIQIVVDGNKSKRSDSPEAKQCLLVQNGHGMNIHLNAAKFKFLRSSTNNALCGTGLEVSPAGNNLRIENSYAGYNGVHNSNMLWADGFTILDSKDSKIRDNLLIDNTDIDLIFGGCVNCQITGNKIIHSDNFAQSAFAGMMIHAWPHTSGNYTGSIIKNNSIGCGQQKMCGFGLLIGAYPWYNAPTFGGEITGNTIQGAQGGLIVNDATGPMTIGPNSVLSSGGSSMTSKGRLNLPAFGISPKSRKNVTFVNGAEKASWETVEFSGAIPNWWK
jgi:hypothetical protein